jgi:hypothetical protein
VATGALLVALGLLGLIVIALVTGRAGADPSTTVTFDIDPTAGQAAISPLIYGINGDLTSYQSTYTADVAAADPTVVRLGGDRWTAYNWENGYSNAGTDYCFENDDYLDPSPSPSPGDAVRGTIEADDAAGISTLVTIPVQGYVSADDNASAPNPSTGSDSACPQDVRNSPAYLTTRFDPSAAVDPAPPTATPSITPGGTVYQDDFVAWLKQNEPSWKPLFELDNEPDDWAGTHPEVHPGPAGYQELVGLDLKYARAIKTVMPSAEVGGPVLGGWDGEIFLGEPGGTSSLDYTNYGNFTTYYLKQVAAADRAFGGALIDDYDIHWYPQEGDEGLDVSGSGTDPATVAEREQRPRSLWDPTYAENSYITEDGGSGPIELIPRLKGQIASAFGGDPDGINLDITEWDYGAGQDISGAIADADALGIFGRSGIHLATYWPLTSGQGYAYAAFRMFTDYDGSGAAFGDTEVQATNSDPANTSIYASIDSSDAHRLILVAINKNTAGETATINLARGASYGAAAVYTLTAAGGAAPVAAPSPLEPTGANTYSYAMPAQSVSVIVPSFIPVPAPPTTTTTTAPKNTVAPKVTGTARAGRHLACSQGSWSGSPTAFAYRWSRDGTPIAGASKSAYRVRRSDQGLRLTCTVRARNAAGTGVASSAGVPVPVPFRARCPGATGKLNGHGLGLVRLGMTRHQARAAYRHSARHSERSKDFFCLTPTGVTVGYGAPALLPGLSRRTRKRLAGRVSWVSTSGAYYAVRGIRVGATATAATTALRTTAPFRIGLGDWYLAPNGASTAVLEVKDGVVADIGIAAKRLARGRAAERILLLGFAAR